MFQKTSNFLFLIVTLQLFVWCYASSNSNNNNNKNNNNNNNNKHQQQNQQNQALWESELTDSFKIDGSDLGIQKVNLKCGSNSMVVVLETEKTFNGVMYTRGSFYKQEPPCFVKPRSIDDRVLEMKFDLDQCHTQKDGELYSNIVVIQNDPELITPGDSAFSLECDFRQPRSLDVGATMQARERKANGSRITLTSPDPTNDNLYRSVHSPTDTVEYVTTQTQNTKVDEEETIHFGTVEEVALNYIEKDEL